MAKKKSGGGGKKKYPRGKPAEVPEITRVKMPNKREGEIFGRIVDILGNERMQVFCEDGKHRIGRIRGKIKKRVWIRRGDLVIVNPWSFETIQPGKMEKCEITWRYENTEITWLEKRNRLPEILDINKIPF